MARLNTVDLRKTSVERLRGLRNGCCGSLLPLANGGRCAVQTQAHASFLTPVDGRKAVWEARSSLEQSQKTLLWSQTWQLCLVWPEDKAEELITEEAVSKVNTMASDREKLTRYIPQKYVTNFIPSSGNTLLELWYLYVVVEVLLWLLHSSQWSRQ